jgi:hypothetical protein
MLLFHGADMGLENSNYHQCYQMLEGDANRLAMQNFLNISLVRPLASLFDLLPCPCSTPLSAFTLPLLYSPAVRSHLVLLKLTSFFS